MKKKLYFCRDNNKTENKMRRSLLLIGIALSFIPCYSWDLAGLTGGRSSAIGGCSVALNDFWSINNNPAGMTCYPYFSAGISYENRFLMKELSYADAALLMPVKIGTFGLSYSRFGYENYNENKVGLAFARAFGPHLKIGLKLDYLAIRFSKDYAIRQNATFELGLQSDITDDFRIGVYIFNPIYVKMKTLNDERVPVIFRFGFAYKITKDFLATTEAEYNSDTKLNYRIGLEYNTLKDFYIRIGVYTKPATACFGVGYTWNKITLDVAATMNQYTGVSFQSSLIFNIK